MQGFDAIESTGPPIAAATQPAAMKTSPSRRIAIRMRAIPCEAAWSPTLSCEKAFRIRGRRAPEHDSARQVEQAEHRQNDRGRMMNASAVTYQVYSHHSAPIVLPYTELRRHTE